MSMYFILSLKLLLPSSSFVIRSRKPSCQIGHLTGGNSQRNNRSTFPSIGNSQQVIVSELNGITYNSLKKLNDDKLHSVFSPLAPTSSLNSRFATNIHIGNHHYLSDLKIVEDGIDLGPSPKELCYSALGSCTVMTIRTFYDNMKNMNTSTSLNWMESSLNNISVTLDEVSDPLNHHVPKGINIQIRLSGQLTQLQGDRLLRAANSCPVKKMLNSNLEIASTLLLDLKE